MNRFLPIVWHIPGCISVSIELRRYASARTWRVRVGGSRYDAARRIIRADNQSDFVRPEVAEAGGRGHKNTYIRAFAEFNPGYKQGDELCCLAPLSRENFTAAAYRVMGLKLAPEYAL